MTEPLLMVGLGEILWDMLPSGAVLGGAPTNFAYMATVFGDEGVVASRIGSDSLGLNTIQQLKSLGVNSAYLQQDITYPTGTANVALDPAGQPTFAIAESVAWDHLELTSEWETLSARADVICFGTLAQRAPVSTETIHRFLCNSRPNALRIFDVNLRQSFYSSDTLKRSLQQANIVKLSDDELMAVATMTGLEGSGNEFHARGLIEQYGLRLVCVTRGARGSLLVSEQEVIAHPGFAVDVVDSVGAGDAFTACVAHHFIRGYPLVEINVYANRFASWVATQTGATPAISPSQANRLLNRQRRA